ncbi:pseudouridine synthase [Rheinheimera maricola]|uniref:Pseudouridine synthase n=1 Tax=Rheinheimera maricola TaxID=2793282 RepID=A0ABS7X6P1_9GAMM|nr:pseudouridine synthase [Rheinheimera maricola]MBZ9610467.1 rRNA pseudouridine synthase [Rheinheimera maricola]
MSSTPSHRLAKYIAMCGHCSRRAAQRLITQGRVNINGAPAKHTDAVTSAELITIDNTVLLPPTTACYLAYHKPVGINCNNRPHDNASIYQLLKQLPQRLFAVGRLDKDSSGLLLLTNDGALGQRLLHPDQQHSKTYVVCTDRSISPAFLQHMATGVSWQLGLKRFQSLPCQIWQSGTQQFHIVLTQGLHRQIRYMCKALGYRVVSLQRIAIGAFALAELAVGDYRPLSDTEVASLLQPAALPQPDT